MTASWVIRDKFTKEGIAETYLENVAKAVNTKKYEAVPVQQHLADINAEERRKRVEMGEDGSANRIIKMLIDEGWKRDDVLPTVLEKHYPPHDADLRVSYDPMGRQYWIGGSYWSEGRNQLAASAFSIKQGLPENEVHQAVLDGIQRMERTINDSFAVRFLSSSPAPKP